MTSPYQPSNDEAKLRERLLSHEFEYRPDAWKAMERHLDGSVLPDQKGHAMPDTTPSPRPTLQVLSVGIVLIVSLLAYLYSQQKDHTPNVEIPHATPAPTSPVAQQPASNVEMPSAATTATSSVAQQSASNVEIPHATPAATSPVAHKSAPNVEMPHMAPNASRTLPQQNITASEKANNSSTANTLGTGLEPSTMVRQQAESDISTILQNSVPSLNIEPSPVSALDLIDNQDKDLNPNNYNEENNSDQLINTTTAPATTTIPTKKIIPTLAFLPNSSNYSVSSVTPRDLIRLGELQIADHAAMPQYKPNWGWGIASGAQWTFLDFDGFANQVLIRPHVGIFAEYKKKAGQSLRAELQYKKVTGYNLTSFKSYITGRNLNVIQISNFRYNLPAIHVFQMPITWQKEVFRQSKWSWIGGVRPALIRPVSTVSLASQLEFFDLSNSNDISPATSYSSIQNGNKGIRSFDIGLVAGLAYQPIRRLAIELRYNQGLLDISRDDFFNTSLDQTNSDVQLSVRYYFNTVTP
jgi:hypothetical protein